MKQIEALDKAFSMSAEHNETACVWKIAHNDAAPWSACLLSDLQTETELEAAGGAVLTVMIV